MSNPERVAQILRYQREQCRNKLSLIDMAEAILLRLPDAAVECAVISEEWIQFCSPSRETVEGLLRTLGAGKLTKKLTDETTARLDYEGVVDGVRIIIHSAEPPKSCRIVEEPEYVPAHNRIRRTLVCH